jgi:hypothetical protein
MIFRLAIPPTVSHFAGGHGTVIGCAGPSSLWGQGGIIITFSWTSKQAQRREGEGRRDQRGQGRRIGYSSWCRSCPLPTTEGRSWHVLGLLTRGVGMIRWGQFLSRSDGETIGTCVWDLWDVQHTIPRSHVADGMRSREGKRRKQGG